MKRGVISRLIALMVVSAIGAGMLIFLAVTSPQPPSSPPEAVPAPFQEPQQPLIIEEPAPTEEQPPEELGVPDAGADIIQNTLDTLKSQAEVDGLLLSELNSGRYTLESPFVMTDPYGVSPLTAIVLFHTEEPMQISVHIPGDTKLGDVDFTFDGYRTDHQIPIYGLYAGRKNQVELSAVTEYGAVKTSTAAIHTAGLPEAFQQETVNTYLPQPEKFQAGMTFIENNTVYTKAAFDAAGDYRWFLDYTQGSTPYSSFIFCTGYSDDGTLYVSCGDMMPGRTVVLNIDLSGKILRAYYSPFGNHHELNLTGNGTLLAAGGNPRTPDFEEDFVYEIDLKTGNIIHSLDYKEILMLTREYDWAASLPLYSKDWCHINSVDQNNESIVVSSNFQSTVICNDWDGNIKWMLCEKTGYPAMYWDKILTPIGSDFEYCYAQHCVRVLPDSDNNPDTVDILMFDNGRSRNYNNTELQKAVALGETVEPPQYSRMVVFRVNEADMTVKQLWSYGKDRLELYSPWRSSAQPLQNGNILGAFQVNNVEETLLHPAYVEVDSKGGLVWECHIESTDATRQYWSYRGERHPLYSESGSYRLLDAPADNLIPKDTLALYGYEPVDLDGAPAPAAESIPDESAPSAPPSDSVWQISLNDVQIRTDLHTVEQVPQYNGSLMDVPHDNVPSGGMQFLLLNLTVAKHAAGNVPFSWDGLSLSLDGGKYSRMDNDSFLSEHGFERIQGTDLKIGSKTGWICIEIPAAANLENAALIYQGEDGATTIPLI